MSPSFRGPSPSYLPRTNHCLLSLILVAIVTLGVVLVLLTADGEGDLSIRRTSGLHSGQ